MRREWLIVADVCHGALAVIHNIGASCTFGPIDAVRVLKVDGEPSLPHELGHAAVNATEPN